MRNTPVSVSVLVGAPQVFDAGSTHQANVGLVNEMGQDLDLLVTLASMPDDQGNRAFDSASWEVELPHGQEVILSEQVQMSAEPVTDKGVMVTVTDNLSGESWTFEFPYTVVQGGGGDQPFEGLTVSVKWLVDPPVFEPGSRQNVYITLENSGPTRQIRANIASVPNTNGDVAYLATPILPQFDLPTGGTCTLSGSVLMVNKAMSDGGTQVLLHDGSTGEDAVYKLPGITLSYEVQPWVPDRLPETIGEYAQFCDWVAQLLIDAGYFGRVELEGWDWFTVVPNYHPGTGETLYAGAYPLLRVVEPPRNYTGVCEGALPAGLYTFGHIGMAATQLNTPYFTVQKNLFEMGNARGTCHVGADVRLGNIMGPNGLPVYAYLYDIFPEHFLVSYYCPTGPGTTHEWGYWKYYKNSLIFLYEYDSSITGYAEPNFRGHCQGHESTGCIANGYYLCGDGPWNVGQAAVGSAYIPVTMFEGWYLRDGTPKNSAWDMFTNMSLEIHNYVDNSAGYDQPKHDVSLSFNYKGPAPFKGTYIMVYGLLIDYGNHPGGVQVLSFGWDSDLISSEGNALFFGTGKGNIDPSNISSIQVVIHEPFPLHVVGIGGQLEFYFDPAVITGEYHSY